MPRQNGMGPQGNGPRTGRGLGSCDRGNYGGACGGVPRRDGSGGGLGNRGTLRQPPKR